MLNKFKVKALTLILVTMYSCIIIALILSCTELRKITYNNFIESAVTNANQQFINIQSYMKLIEETSKHVSKNENIFETLKSHSYDIDTTGYLNSIKQAFPDISCIAITTLNGITYTSDSVSSYPNFEEIRKDSSVENFIDSGMTQQWCIRYVGFAQYYNSTYYNSNNGILTFVSKICDKNNILYGYLLVDIIPNDIYDYLTQEDKIFNFNSKTILANNSGIALSVQLNNSIDKSLYKYISKGIKSTKNYDISPDNKYILVYNSIYINNLTAVTFIPLNGLFAQLNHDSIILIIITVFLLILSFLGSIILVRSISIPLNNLYKKMKGSMR